MSYSYQSRNVLFSDRDFCVDPFGGAKPCLLRRGKEAPLRVNPEQARAFRPGSRRVDLKIDCEKVFLNLRL